MKKKGKKVEKKSAVKVGKKSVKKLKKLVVKTKNVENRVALAKELTSEIEHGHQVAWVDEMSTQEAKIDQQHKTLLMKMDDVIENSNTNDLGEIRGILQFLGNYVQQHFSYEEEYMKKVGYPKKDFDIHKKIHQDFIKFYLGYKKDFEKLYSEKELNLPKMKALLIKARKYLGEWLVNHIIIMDHKYAEFVAFKDKKTEKKFETKSSKKIDMGEIKKEIEGQLKSQRAPVEGMSELKEKKGKSNIGYAKTGVPGFDELFDNGIPLRNSVIVAGGAGSGKTIFCLQTLINKSKEGKKCLYMTLEEREDRLIEHMEGFGWKPDDLIKKGKLKIVRMNPFDITRNVDAMLAKQKGELLIEVDPVIIPRDFKPDFIVIDSLTAIASAFTNKDESYRIYIEQLFRFLERMGTTSFLITETEQVPKIYSTTGVEEFLADGVIVLYNIKRGDVRENAIEVLKMRGEKHQKKIVAMQITGEGIMVYPEQEVFGGIE